MTLDVRSPCWGVFLVPSLEGCFSWTRGVFCNHAAPDHRSGQKASKRKFVTPFPVSSLVHLLSGCGSVPWGFLLDRHLTFLEARSCLAYAALLAVLGRRVLTLPDAHSGVWAGRRKVRNIFEENKLVNVETIWVVVEPSCRLVGLRRVVVRSVG